MTAVKQGDIARFLASPPAGVAVALFYGPNQGLVRDRAAAMLKAVLSDDPDDPFALTVLTEDDLSGPGQIVDEAMALSLSGAARAVRVRGAGDKTGKGVKQLLEAVNSGGTAPAAVTIVEAGDLKKTSALRKSCEASRHAAAIACYAEEGTSLMDTVRQKLKAERLDIEDEALLAFITALGDDRGLVNSETEKLILYMGPAAVRKDAEAVTAEDVRAVLTGSSDEAPFELLELALTGHAGVLSAALHRSRTAGNSPLGLIRMLQGRLLRLLTVKAAIDDGQPPAAAMKLARPPVFRGEERAFNDQLRLWPRKVLERTIADTLDVENAAKRTGAPQAELVERHLLRIALVASRPGR